MSTSNASSPASAASPHVLAPSTVNQPLAPIPTSIQTPSIFTHKEWVVPPRPKPGRKPAADTPPTKRKAQNRQAQRAFRERRAARVGELEDLMKKMEEEDAQEQVGLRARITQLEADLDSYNQLMLSWRQKMQDMQAAFEEERKLRWDAEAEVTTLRSVQKDGTDAVPLPPRPNRQEPQARTTDPIRETQILDQYKDVPIGCGKCSEDTRCECIEEAFDIGNISTIDSDAPGKRPHSPPTDKDHKRLRQEEAESNEIDFTARFSSKKPPNLTTSTSTTSITPAPAVTPDPCGFCQDGTPCICAEMALEATKSESRPSLSRIQSYNQSSKSSAPSSNPCINGPGTCDKCLVDANSTLFCKSLAATRSGYRPNPLAIKDSMESPPPTPTSSSEFPTTIVTANSTHTSTTTGPTLSCADAYETLSRHPEFEQASLELSTWMPQLATVPGGRERTAFEVEAASVMGVLRFFDRRFGKGKGGADASHG
ncbi:MAG: hypothetical protein Q9181_003668 [Wetmoreana brouardii]